MAKRNIMLRNTMGMLQTGENISLEIVRDDRNLIINARIAELKRGRVETAGLPEKFSGTVFDSLNQIKNADVLSIHHYRV